MAAQHIVHSYDAELRFLIEKIIEMSKCSEKMLAEAMQAMLGNDANLAAKIINDDKRLDELEREIDEHAIILIGKRQPMANDLREIVGTIRISSDFERIGDMGKNIAKRVKAMTSMHQGADFYQQMQTLTALVLKQLGQVRSAYVSRSLTDIEMVLKLDEETDTIYTNIFRHLLELMAQDKEKITLCTHLLFCAKNIERVGDHATNIVEIIHYMITGSHLSFERVRKDLTHMVIN